VEKFCRAGQATDENIIRLMSIVRWILKVTNSLSEYVIFIVFPLQQWLHERSSVLRYMYIVSLA